MDDPIDVSHRLHTVSRDCFHKAICELSKRATNQKPATVHNICILFCNLLKYIQVLFQNPEVVTPLIQWNSEVRH